MEIKVLFAVLAGILFMIILSAKPMLGFYIYVLARPIIDSFEILQVKKIIGPINILQAIGIVWPFSLVLVCVFRGGKLFQNREGNIYLTFIFLSMPSIFLSSGWLNAAADWLKLVTLWSVLIFVISFVDDNKKVRTLFAVILLSSFYPILSFAISFFHSETMIKSHIVRYTGGYFHMGPVSFLLLLLAASYLFFISIIKSKSINFLLLIGLISISVCIYYTYYRSTLIALFVLMCSYLFLKKKFVHVILLLACGCVALFMSEFLRSRFMPLIDFINNIELLLDPDNASYDYLLSGRFGIWRRIITMYLYEAKLQNVFFGFGYNVDYNNFVIHPHNDYLNIFLQNGFIAMICFMVFWGAIISKGLQVRGLAAANAALSATIASLVLALATNYFVSVRVGLYMGIYAGIIVNTFERNKKDISDNGQ